MGSATSKMTDEDVDSIAQELCRAYDGARATAERTDSCWLAAARAAIDLGARPRRLDARARLAEMLGADSTNFLGTGLALREFMQLHDAEKLAASWALQDKEEKQRRLGAVTRLAIELERVREHTHFSTRVAELAIEAVIEGAWKRVEEWAEHFSYDGESDEVRTYGQQAYEKFRELLLQACRAGKEAAA